MKGHLNYKSAFKTFSVINRSRTQDPYGGWTDAWTGNGTTFDGVITQAQARELELAQQLNYPVSHTIVTEGAPLAVIGQRIALGIVATSATPAAGVRQFQVQNVDDPGELGAYTVYHVEEMR